VIFLDTGFLFAHVLGIREAFSVDRAHPQRHRIAGPQ
jgi:hypothetical protein